jgi:hypothetical protein
MVLGRTTAVTGVIQRFRSISDTGAVIMVGTTVAAITAVAIMAVVTTAEAITEVATSAEVIQVATPAGADLAVVGADDSPTDWAAFEHREINPFMALDPWIPSLIVASPRVEPCLSPQPSNSART